MAADWREGYSDGRVNDSLPLLQLVLNVLEWSSAIDHLIEDTTKGPDITGTTNLERERERERKKERKKRGRKITRYY